MHLSELPPSLTLRYLAQVLGISYPVGMPPKRAPYAERALQLLRTHPPKAAHEILVADFPDLKLNNLHVFKNAHKAELEDAPTRHDPGEFLPWDVSTRHRSNYDAMMLSLLSKRMHHVPLASTQVMHLHQSSKLDNWLTKLYNLDQVVDYSRATGFSHVPRRYYLPVPNIRRAIDPDVIKLPNRNDDGSYK